MKSIPAVLAAVAVVAFAVPAVPAYAVEPPAAAAAELKTVTLDVTKMDCPMCRITIRKALEKVPGVTEASVDYDAKTATVTFDPSKASPEALTEATANAGYPSTLRPN